RSCHARRGVSARDATGPAGLREAGLRVSGFGMDGEAAMTERIGIVWNPTKIDEDALRDAAATGLAGDVLWWETSEDDPGRAMAQAAVEAGCDVVVAVGGDGTVRTVAEVLAGVEGAPRLGIVPQGTGNLLARNLGIP